ncbi:threonine/serine exporter family protein [Proteinivorax hydrogeniformans]|uniref:Threonine/serine exporter family protein n=1 Tax=Proteinivorax hydrogeniformans TaxID=1826727 RepID=A0AAU8HW90_9FIRM
MILENFFFALLATLGYCIVFNVPKKYLLLSSFGGAIGWITYVSFNSYLDSPVTAVFIASSIVGLWGEILSVKIKDLVTIFIIPGIIPLVPGSGMYYTALAIADQDFEQAAATGSETLFIAITIASGIILVSSLSRLIRGRKIMSIKH